MLWVGLIVLAVIGLILALNWNDIMATINPPEDNQGEEDKGTNNIPQRNVKTGDSETAAVTSESTTQGNVVKPIDPATKKSDDETGDTPPGEEGNNKSDPNVSKVTKGTAEHFLSEGEYYFSLNEDCKDICGTELGVNNKGELGFVSQVKCKFGGPSFRIKCFDIHGPLENTVVEKHPIYLTPVKTKGKNNFYHISRIDRKVRFYDYFNMNADGPHAYKNASRLDNEDIRPVDNDMLSSVYVPPGMGVTLYEHIRFKGQTLELFRPNENLTKLGFENRTTSAVVEECDINEKPTCFTEHKHKNYLTYTPELGFHFSDYWDSEETLALKPPVWELESSPNLSNRYAFKLVENIWSPEYVGKYIAYIKGKEEQKPGSYNRHYYVLLSDEKKQLNVAVIGFSDTPTYWEVDEA